MEPQLHGVRPWRDKMGSTEGGKKVIERRLVCQINNVGLQAPLVSVTVEEIVVAHCYVKKASRRYPWRVMVVVLRPRRWDVYAS